MSELASQQCEACRADATKVSDEELRELMQLIPDWQPLVEEGRCNCGGNLRFATSRRRWRLPTAWGSWRKRSSIIRPS